MQTLVKSVGQGGVNLSADGFSADNDAYTTVRMLKRRQVLLVASSRYPRPESMTMK